MDETAAHRRWHLHSGQGRDQQGQVSHTQRQNQRNSSSQSFIPVHLSIASGDVNALKLLSGESGHGKHPSPSWKPP